MKRKIYYTLIFLSFLWWTKNNKPDEYKAIEKNFIDLNIPFKVFLDVIDSLIFYKSEVKALKVLINYYSKREENLFRERVNDLWMWSKQFN